MTDKRFHYSYDKEELMSRRGFHGRFLRVDLTTGSIWLDDFEEDFYRLHVGGRAVVAYYLLKETPPGIDPFSPENLLIFAPGILTGTSLQGSGRHGIGAKSPLTGAIASSEAGGWWGTELKRAGIDGLVVSGRAQEPVYLSIMDGEVAIHGAKHLWGQKTAQVERAIRKELGDNKIRVAQIGLAGENLVRFAAIINDFNRAAGRAGLGAVMGSKNLKAVAVRGTQRFGVADNKKVLGVSRWLGQNYKELSRWRIDMGTPATVLISNKAGALPTRNFQEPIFEHAEDVSGETMHASYIIDRDTCAVCPIRCKQVVEIDDGKYTVDPVYGGPEFETLATFGPHCGNGDLAAICKANELCAAYGLDTISTGGVIGFVMECFAKELLSEEATGGFSIHFGDGESIVQAVEMIAHMQGFGKKMAMGAAHLAQEIGPDAEALLMTVKKLEMPYHEPRFKFAIGLGYTVAPVGADHMMNVHDTNYLENGAGLKRLEALDIKMGPQPLDSLAEEKVRAFTYEVNWQHFQDTAVTCMFFPYQYYHLAEALCGATGWEIDAHDVITIGERANTLTRLYNIREGIDAKQDRLPKRFFQGFTEGPLRGVAPTPRQLETAKRTYYELMGWDPETGIPTAERLQKLGLDWAVGVLSKG